MQPLPHAVLCLLLSCCFQDAEARSYVSTVTVPNGGQWGKWGETEFCPYGYATGFSLKVERFQGPGVKYDDTSMNGIRLYCTDGSSIESTVGPWGEWTRDQRCQKSYLTSFSLQVELPQRNGDDTAANNINFECSDGSWMVGVVPYFTDVTQQTNRCISGSICGIQTKVQTYQGKGDDTALNDVKFFCCK